MSHLARAAGALILGVALILAFPPYDQWYIAVLVPAAIALIVRDQPLKRSALYGLAFGLGFFVPFLYWTGLETGPIPWVLLSILQALFFVPLTVGLTLVQRLPGWPVWTAAVWIAVEALRGRIPYGGFTWGKLAFAQADSPFIGLATLGGSPLVSFAVALAGGLLAWVVVGRRWWLRAGGLVAAAALTFAGLFVTPPTPDGDTVTVAVVQGNVPEPGLDYNSKARVVTANHVEATHRLAEDVEAGRVERPDLVIWPENSSDISPYHDAETYRAIDEAVREIGVPVLISAIVPTEDEKNVKNTSIVWDPVTGPGAEYVKRHPMPFGEYIPFRGLAAIITDAVKHQPRDHLPGDTVGVLEMGPATIGDVICFEVAFDDIVRDAVAQGGQLLAVQTNNATFRYSPMTEQQLAMSRLRAVEHGRTILVAALAGVSAVVSPDGEVLDRAELYTQDVMVADVVLSDATTPATTVGAWPEWAACAAAAAALAMGMWRGRRRGGPAPEPAPPANVPAGVA